VISARPTEDAEPGPTEAARVVRAGGPVFVAAINRHASLLDEPASGELFDPVLGAIVAADLTSGQYRDPTSHPDRCTTAYFHHPDQLRVACEDAGLSVGAVISVEGLPAWLPQLADRWGTVEGRATSSTPSPRSRPNPPCWASALTWSRSPQARSGDDHPPQPGPAGPTADDPECPQEREAVDGHARRFRAGRQGVSGVVLAPLRTTVTRSPGLGR
jgi:hypothetical protein